MKVNKAPDFIDPKIDLELAKKESLELAKKRAYISAGAAIIPIPFLDVAIDASILSVLLPEINAKFGLAPEQMTVYSAETKKIQWDELRRRGIQFTGLIITRGAVKKSINSLFGKMVIKQVTKFIPLGGQIVAASLGYTILKRVANAHIEESYQLAKKIQMKDVNPSSKKK